jgi:hypothetical protein
VAPRTRILSFGAAGLLVLAGALCAVFVGGVVGEVLTIVLLSAGFGGALLLVFLEIGLGEERDVASEEARRARARRLSGRHDRPRLGLTRRSRTHRRPRRPQ